MQKCAWVNISICCKGNKYKFFDGEWENMDSGFVSVSSKSDLVARSLKGDFLIVFFMNSWLEKICEVLCTYRRVVVGPDVVKTAVDEGAIWLVSIVRSHEKYRKIKASLSPLKHVIKWTVSKSFTSGFFNEKSPPGSLFPTLKLCFEYDCKFAEIFESKRRIVFCLLAWAFFSDCPFKENDTKNNH
jgi:hypothetical protein